MELWDLKYLSIIKLTAGFKSVVRELGLKKCNTQPGEPCAWLGHTVEQHLANKS